MVLEVIEFPGSSLTVALSSQENGTFVRSDLCMRSVALIVSA